MNGELLSQTFELSFTANWFLIPSQLSLPLVGAATSIIFVMTKHVFCCDESMLVVTKHLSKQNYVAAKYFCHDKSFVATSTCLSQQKVCCDKFVLRQIFVTTKMVLVVAPANDSQPSSCTVHMYRLYIKKKRKKK